MSDPTKLIVGRLGTYLLLERIGKGGYGTVYKGIWREEGKHVAVKRVSKRKLHAEERKALESEIDLFKNLQDDHIVNYIEAVDDGDRAEFLDIVMEYVEGGSLEKFVKEIVRGSSSSDMVLPESLVAKFTAQILQGLSYLHKQGVVHRDIKGANILITKESQVKLTDFGVSCVKPASALDSGMASEDVSMDFVGTPYWVAPEVISLSGFGTASDIWSLGCTVIELLTANPPYHELNEMSAMFRIVTDERPALPAGISPELEQFLVRCFDKDMNGRISADDALRHRWILGNQPPPAPLTNIQRTPTNRDQHPASDPSSVLKKYEEVDIDEFGDIDFVDTQGLEGTDSRSSSIEESRPEYQDEVSNLPGGCDAPYLDTMDIFDQEAEEERERARSTKERWQLLKRQVSSLAVPQTRLSSCRFLVELLGQNPEQIFNFIRDPGILPLLEVLEIAEVDEITEAELNVVLQLISSGKPEDPTLHPSNYLGFPQVKNIKRDLCLAGMLPVILPYTDSRYSLGVRKAAAKVLEAIADEDSTIHMLIACRGFVSFVDLIEADLDQFGSLTEIGIKGMWRFLNVDNQMYRNDFCRRFAKLGIMHKIVDGVAWFTKRNCPERYGRKVSALLEILQVMAERSDLTIKSKVAAPQVLEPLVLAIPVLPVAALESLVCALRDLSRDPNTHLPLLRAKGIPNLVLLLSLDTVTERMEQNIMSTMYNLCRVSQKLREAAALSGITPHLQHYIKANTSYLRNLSIEIYSQLGAASSRTRAELWKHNGLQFYLDLIGDLNGSRWLQIKLLNSTVEWLERDRERVEGVLIEPGNLNVLERLIGGWSLEHIEQLLETYNVAITASSKLNHALVQTPILKVLLRWLTNPLVRKPRVRLLILKILLCHSREDTSKFRTAEGLNVGSILLSASKDDDAIIVRQQALLLLEELGIVDDSSALIQRASDEFAPPDAESDSSDSDWDF